MNKKIVQGGIKNINSRNKQKRINKGNNTKIQEL